MEKILPSIHASFKTILLNANMKVMLFHDIQITQPKLSSFSFFYYVLSSVWMIGIYLQLFRPHVKPMNTFVHEHDSKLSTVCTESPTLSSVKKKLMSRHSRASAIAESWERNSTWNTKTENFKIMISYFLIRCVLE